LNDVPGRGGAGMPGAFFGPGLRQDTGRIMAESVPAWVPGERAGYLALSGPARCRATTIRWIWFVPSTICRTFASRMYRSAGKSTV
jgi:hypothetical protein